MLFQITIIYGDNSQQTHNNISANNKAEARAKAEATASCSARAHGGVKKIIVNPQ